jgi:hypothetical protein
LLSDRDFAVREELAHQLVDEQQQVAENYREDHYLGDECKD